MSERMTEAEFRALGEARRARSSESVLATALEHVAIPALRDALATARINECSPIPAADRLSVRLDRTLETLRATLSGAPVEDPRDTTIREMTEQLRAARQEALEARLARMPPDEADRERSARTVLARVCSLFPYRVDSSDLLEEVRGLMAQRAATFAQLELTRQERDEALRRAAGVEPPQTLTVRATINLEALTRHVAAVKSGGTGDGVALSGALADVDRKAAP